MSGKQRSILDAVRERRAALAPPPSPMAFAACGHADAKPKPGKKCAACRKADHAARTVAERQAAVERRAAKASAEAAVRASRRLPDGSEFHVKYDAAAETWTGTLEVRHSDGVVAFAGKASGVFRLLKDLDRQYRVWADAQAGKGGAA